MAYLHSLQQAHRHKEKHKLRKVYELVVCDYKQLFCFDYIIRHDTKQRKVCTFEVSLRSLSVTLYLCAFVPKNRAAS
jgi:hypothetical protein